MMSESMKKLEYCLHDLFDFISNKNLESETIINDLRFYLTGGYLKGDLSKEEKNDNKWYVINSLTNLGELFPSHDLLQAQALQDTHYRQFLYNLYH